MVYRLNTDPRPARHHGWARALQRASAALLRLERFALTGLLALITLLVLLNVVTRYARVPLYWVDEAVVYLVVWLCFVGASAMTRLRLDFAVTLLTDQLGAQAARRVKILATCCTLAFGMALIAMCWIWLDPVGIARHGFDARAYAEESFNFLYTERTQTLEWPTWVVQLAVPIFALGFTLHVSANLVEDLGLCPRELPAGFELGDAETAVN